MSDAEKSTTEKPAKALGARLENWPANASNTRGGVLRAVKMMRPICDTCSKTGAFEWWKTCKHGPYGDPYYSFSKLSEPIFASEMVDGRLVGTPGGDKVWYEPVPNLAQIPLSERVGNSSQHDSLIDRKRLHGFILPEEHPTHPLAGFCQYYNCFSTKTRRYQTGVFCREIEAKLVRLVEEEGTTVEVHNDRVRRRQLAQVNVG